MSPFAADPTRSRGRLHAEEASPWRDAFARDRDRVVHSAAFRRLRHKTQVFASPDGDHYRVRLTHSLEVAQIARTLAAALGLNEALTETCALGHDLGHPPFGHSGEDALTAEMAPYGGFDHNGHGLRILTALEHRTPTYDGLNLTWESLEGLAKHNGPVARPQWALAAVDAAYPLDLQTWPSLEAQVAALADDIAYDAHDLDDGIRAGLVGVEQAAEAVPLVGELWRGVRRRFPGAEHRLVPHLIRDLIGVLVDDLLAETRRRLDAARPESADDVRAAGHALAAFSPEGEALDRAMKRCLRANMYAHPEVLAVRAPAEQVVRGLFAALHDDPSRLPPRWRETLPASDPERAQHVGDYVAGMTDRFALREYARVVGEPPRIDALA
jgi:dGTPase